MQIEGWRYYNHAAIPTTPIHENPNMQPIEDGSIWRLDGAPLLARWITEFDCGYETGWWYVIKDTPFDISQLKAKRRYEINKGIKNFDVRVIDPREYKEALYNVQVAAFSAYPEKYRPTVNKEDFFAQVDSWSDSLLMFGAFYRETNELVGYASLSHSDDNYIGFYAQKTKPEYEKYAINAALVEAILRYFEESISNGKFISDGARSINHETAFQDYLEKYFGFRKAYCHIHLAYNPKVKWIIRFLFPFHKILKKMDSIGILHQINAILRMEEICRNDNKKQAMRLYEDK